MHVSASSGCSKIAMKRLASITSTCQPQERRAEGPPMTEDSSQKESHRSTVQLGVRVDFNWRADKEAQRNREYWTYHSTGRSQLSLACQSHGGPFEPKQPAELLCFLVPKEPTRETGCILLLLLFFMVYEIFLSLGSNYLFVPYINPTY